MLNNFRNKFPVSDKQWKDFTKRVKHVEVPAKTILLHEGEVSKTAYFIEKGCLRVWVNNDGKDVSCQFFFEGENVSSIESLKTTLLQFNKIFYNY